MSEHIASADVEQGADVATEAPAAKAEHPAWVPCQCCEEFFCTIHLEHACDCACPAVEDWAVDPYSTGGKPLAEEPGGAWAADVVEAFAKPAHERLEEGAAS